jgi:CRISPR/Cas system CSM-associated protein Csm3 (group 7 of RAMP superfamily)
VSLRADSLHIDYRLQFESPFHLGTGLRSGLIHRAVARDAEGYLYVPGSTIKGAVRGRATWLSTLLGLPAREPHNTQGDLTEAIAATDITTCLFGSRFMPGSLYFDDLTMSKDARDFFDRKPGEKDQFFLSAQTQPRTQVSLSPITRSARPGHLFTSEYGLPTLSFDGVIYGQVRGVPTLSDDRFTHALLILVAGLLCVDSMGANKSVGAGKAVVTINKILLNGQDQSFQELLQAFQFDEGEFDYLLQEGQ